jgi:3-hydroxy acid dehydrogenase/malonic semialdehyde reductase
MNGRTQVAFVTGASSGFGSAIARHLAATGFRVVAAARRAGRVEALAALLGRETVLPVKLDVSDRASVDHCIGGLPPGFAEVDLLVNNAGAALGLEPAMSADLDEWEQMVDTNCKGTMYMTRALVPGMVSRGKGHIVNIGSVAGTYPYPGGNVYGATKSFVRQFSLNLRADLHGTGVKVSCIEPGMCGGTEFSEVRFRGDTQKAAAVYSGMKPLTAEDIAATVDWVTRLPDHVNVNTIELMPVAQSFAAFQVSRQH